MKNKTKDIIIDFYLIDSFEIFHFFPLYIEFINSGMNARFISEPQYRNTAKKWYDYKNAISILDEKKVLYLKKYRRNADIVFTTQDSYILKKYKKTTKKINLSYGFSFKKDYFIHSDRTTKGFDYRFVHGSLQKNIISKYIDEKRIIEVGYPKYYKRINNFQSTKDIRKELGIVTEKPILVYFPTWDEDNTIQKFSNSFNNIRENFFVVSKAHHCTNEEKNPNDYHTLCSISDIVLDGNYDFGKACLIGDVAIADAKSGASLEVSYVNNDIPIILLLKSKEEIDKYDKMMWEFFEVVDDPQDLIEKIPIVKENDYFINKRKDIIQECFGYYQCDYMSKIVDFIKQIVN